jgi:hypothetical protein
MKKQILAMAVILGIILLVSTLSGVYGKQVENRIFSLSLKYESGNINLVNVTLKYGFAPGRETQPTSGYTAEIISTQNAKLYSFRFEVPNQYLQVPPLEGQPTGSVITLDNVNFTLITPYFTDAKQINIYNPDNKLLLSVDVSQYVEKEGSFINSSYLILAIAVIAIIIVILVIIYLRKRKSNKEKSNKKEKNKK